MDKGRTLGGNLPHPRKTTPDGGLYTMGEISLSKHSRLHQGENSGDLASNSSMIVHQLYNLGQSVNLSELIWAMERMSWAMIRAE